MQRNDHFKAQKFGKAISISSPFAVAQSRGYAKFMEEIYQSMKIG